MKVLEEFQEMKMEENRLNDYKQELELLEEERLAHVEELRQIHADMKAVSHLISHAELKMLKTFISKPHFCIV